MIAGLYCRSPVHRQSRLKLYLCTQPVRWFTRPTFAPHPIPDTKHIAQNPGLYEQNCIDRNYGKLSQYSWQVAQLREQRLRWDHETVSNRQRFNQLQKDIQEVQQHIKRSGDGEHGKTRSDQDALSRLESAKEEAKQLKSELDIINSHMKRNDAQIMQMALALPNLSSVHTPNGTQARILDTVINVPEYLLARLDKSHIEIGNELSILNFSQSSTTTGWGWYFLHGAGALLEQALVQYAISVLVRHGWQVVSPPSVVYSHIANACGFQPRDQNDEQQIYTLESQQDPNVEERDRYQHVLAGTAEIPLAGMQAETILKEQQLPLKTAAVSRAYRAEAGARGVNTKGLYRVHEFTKVEMFAWTMPDNDADSAAGGFDTSSNTPSQANQVLAEMVDIQRDILSSLGLNFQILEMPSTDLGASATRKIDMEVYFPSRREKDGGWGEVTSTSLCTDYQTRRLKTRLQRLVGPGARAGSGKLDFPWTLNGTAMAIPRILAAILECRWDVQKQQVAVPEVLKPWMHGIDIIEAKNKVG